MMETGCVIVLTTIPSAADGKALASTLVGEHLAACVNVLGEMDSIYRWQGSIETERERQVIIKTTAAKIDALKARLHELHSYDVPEFMVLSVTGGSEPYLGWVRNETA